MYTTDNCQHIKDICFIVILLHDYYDVIMNVECIIELAMVRDNMLQLSSDVFSLMDIRDVISFLCTG